MKNGGIVSNWARSLHIEQLTMRRSLEFASAGCTLMLGCTLAQPGGVRLTDIEMAYIASAVTWDRNRDGVVSCDEWRDYLEELLKQADKDKDGRLTRAEFATFHSIDKLFVLANFDYFDANKDGFIDRAELFDKANPAFTILDKDRNCVLTVEELAWSRRLQRPAPSNAMPSDKGKGGPPGGKM